MNKLKRFSRLFLALALCVISLCGMSVTAFAYVDPDASANETVDDAAVPEATESEANPFTPDGNGSILDEADSDQNKYFYTIQTANDNVFYMVIDKDRASGNVYLLSMIDENDLMEFVTEEETESEDNGAIPDEFKQPTKPAETEPETETENETEPEVTDPPAETSNGTVTLIALGVLAVIFLVGYYVVKIRNKDDTEDDEDETSHGMEDTEEEDDTDETELMDDDPDTDAPFSEDYPDPADYPDEENV